MSENVSSGPPSSGGPPPATDNGDQLKNLRNAWTRSEKIIASGVLAFFVGSCVVVYTLTAMITKFQVNLEHRLDGLATSAQLEKTREAILNRMDTHDEVFKDLVSVLESASKGVFAIPINRARIEERLDRAREKTQASFAWNRRSILKPFEEVTRRQGRHIVMLAAGDITPVAAGAAGVAHRIEGGVEISMNPPAIAVAGWPTPLNAASSGGESLMYRGLTDIDVVEGQPISRGDTIGRLARKDRSQVAAMKLTIEYRVAGMAIDPPAHLPELNLGLELFEFKCASCHTARAGAGPSLSQLRSRKLSSEDIARELRRGGPRMPSFEKILSAEEESALVELLTAKPARVEVARR